MILKIIGGFFLDIIETVVIALSIFLIIYLFIAQPHQVNGNSMYPYFENGEYIMTDKISYYKGSPKRGDIIVFHSPQSAHCPQGTGCDFIKRVIGLPKEKIEIKNNKVFINSKQIQENYLPENFTTQSGQFTANGPVLVPENKYFVLGDNRNHSSDSRFWGFVDKSEIVGKAFFRYWPLNKTGLLKSITY